jgi:hypothetical protein
VRSGRVKDVTATIRGAASNNAAPIGTASEVWDFSLAQQEYQVALP